MSAEQHTKQLNAAQLMEAQREATLFFEQWQGQGQV